MATALDVLLGAIEPVRPHPDLVASVRPTPAQMAVAASYTGWLSDDEDRYLRPVVAA